VNHTISKAWRFEIQVFTCSEASQKLAMVLDQAESTGKVLIRRKGGRTFALIPVKLSTSLLDVPSIKADISTEEKVDIIRAGRER
jgi:antitoxin Phd